jgi:hypothetical protein
MRSVDRLHSPAPEELMEFADGEGSAATRAAIEAHLADCAECRTIVSDQRGLSRTLGGWRVAPPPASLRAPAPRRARVWWRPSPSIAAGLAAAAIVLLVVAVNQRPDRPRLNRPAAADAVAALPEPPTATRAVGGIGSQRGQANEVGAAVDRLVSPAPAPSPAQTVVRTPSVIRTATLQIVARDFAAARASVESIVADSGGFVDHLTVTGDTERARVLRGAVRVPSDRMRDALNQLRALGQVIEDTQGSQDVTDQIVDLDARLATARATEQRLTALLRDRTGRLSDVLEVERELTRVRLDIERLDAEKNNVTRRVSYATINLGITEERKASLDGPLSLATRLKVAAVDGIEAALDSIAAVVLFALRAGPALLVWGTVFGLAWLTVRRSGLRGKGIRDSRTPTASE